MNKRPTQDENFAQSFLLSHLIEIKHNRLEFLIKKFYQRKNELEFCKVSFQLLHEFYWMIFSVLNGFINNTPI